MNNNDYDYEDIDFDMDYEWVYDEDLEKHKTKDKVKWILTTIALLLITVALVCVCLKVFWKPQEQVEEQPSDENKVLHASARIDPEHYAENGIDEHAVNAYTITATVQPETADNKAVVWSIMWSDPNGTWSSGKDIAEYITLSSTTANPVTVTCLQPFGAQALITCTSQDNNELTATCTVDYMQKASGIVPAVKVGNMTYSLHLSTPTLPITSNAKLSVEVNKTSGSMADEFTVKTTVRFSNECIAWLESKFDQWGTGYSKQATIADDGTLDIAYLLSENNPDSLFIPNKSGGIFGSSAGSMYFYQYLLPEFNNQTFPKLLFIVTVTDSKGNKSEYEYKAGLDRLTVAAVSLSVNNTAIVF